MNFFPLIWDHVDVVRDEANYRAGYGRIFRSRQDAFELPEEDFVSIFRLKKAMVNNLIDSMTDHAPLSSRESTLNPTVKVLTALRFLASGCYQTDIGLNYYMAISQPSVSRCIHALVDLLNQPDIFNKWVHFPRNLQELDEIRHGFYKKYHIRGAVGCIDCTHVAIVPPKHDIEYLYVNRKGYHSINVQLICDANYRILHANARYPGRSHDSFIWNNSRILPIMEKLHASGHEDYFLIGDSGYGLRPWLMTPIIDANPGSPEERYTRRISHIRSIIERVNAVLKMRFRCLLKHRFLHYDPAFASRIINACIVLHNMCIANHLVPPMMPTEDEGSVDFGMHRQFPEIVTEKVVRRVNPDLAKGRIRQRQIIEAYFT